MEYKKRFGDNLRQLRERAGLSQHDLSRRCDLDRSGIWSLEQGYRQPTLVTLVKLAKVLEADLNALGAGIEWDEASLKIAVEPVSG